jgi:hypothetical protein
LLRLGAKLGLSLLPTLLLFEALKPGLSAKLGLSLLPTLLLFERHLLRLGAKLGLSLLPTLLLFEALKPGLSAKLGLSLLPALLSLKSLLGLPYGTLITSRAQPCRRPGLLLKNNTVQFVLLYALPRSS